MAEQENDPQVGNTTEEDDDDSAKEKETFQWNTPADEFAEDVASDVEEESEDEAIADANRDNSTGEIIELSHQSEIINGQIGLGEPEEKPKKAKPKHQFPCPKCNKIWNWPWELRRHLVMHFKEKERQDASAYKCEECGRGFQWKRDLAQHKRLHTGEKLLICSVCGKKFTTRQALLHHVVVHTGEKPFQCAQCGNRFTQPANLRTHMKKKHGGTTIKGNKCPHCGEVFPSVIAVHQHILDDHQQIVAEERESQAMERLRKEQERAEKDRIRDENRRRREERRRERMDFNDFRPKGMKEWEINYEFHLGDGLVRGVDWDRTPSNGELPCDQCPRKFGWRYEIMFHSLCHMMDQDGNPKNKVCPECDTVFKVPIGLKHHLLLHTGELPFLCLHCWRSFSSHIDLKLHIRREHLFHLDMPTSKPSASPKVKKLKGENLKEEIKSGEFIAVAADASGETLEGDGVGGQQVQFVMAADGEDGEHEGAQTIVLGSDAAAQYVDSNGQDMIVVIQSDDFDQSQGLIVVDPSQLQQMVSSGAAQMQEHQAVTTTASAMTIVGDGENPTTTTAANSESQEMIVSDQPNEQSSQDEYISLQMPDGTSQSGTLVLAQGEGEGGDGEQGYIVVTAQEDSKGNFVLHQEEEDEEDQKSK